MAEIRCYMVIDAAAPRTEVQWDALKGAVKNKPMLQVIRNLGAAHNLPHLEVISKRMSLNLRYALVRFVVDESDNQAALAVLNTQCALHGITGTAQQKFNGEIQFELREAAVDLGYTQTQANNLITSIIGYDVDSYTVAIAGAQAYITANSANWESVE